MRALIRQTFERSGIAFLLCLAVNPAWASANPRVSQGGGTIFALTGHASPSAHSGGWDIYFNGQVLATASSKQGWKAYYYPTGNQVKVYAPLSAAIAKSYEVRLAEGTPVQHYSAFFDVVAGISSTTVAPSPIVSGASATGTVTLTAGAPSGGTTVNLSASSTAAGVPVSINIPEGQTSGTFPVTGNPVPALTNLTISADHDSVTLHAPLAVEPLLASVTATADSQDPSYTCSVTLNAPAPPGGMNVALSSSSQSVTVPAMVSVAAGATTSSQFAADTTQVSVPTTATIQASYAGAGVSASFSIDDIYVAYRSSGDQYAPGGLSNGTDTSQMTETIWTFPQACTDIQAVYYDYALEPYPAFPETPGVSTLTVYAALEYPASSGNLYPLTFGGAPYGTMGPDDKLVSDPLPNAFPAGAVAQVRSYVTCAAGGQWPFVTHTDSFFNEGASPAGTSPANLALPGSGDVPRSENDGFDCYGITGRPIGARPASVVCIGDSIAEGSHDEIAYNAGIGYLNRSFLKWGTAALVNLSQGTMSAIDFLQNPDRCTMRLEALPNGTYLLCQLGKGDYDADGLPLATVQASLAKMWQDGAQAGLRVVQTTFMPYTTSTDDWLTTTHQSNSGTGVQEPNEAVRQALNQWLRAPASAGPGKSALADYPGLLWGILDTDAAVEVNLNGSAIQIDPTTGAISNGVGGYWYATGAAYGPVGPGAQISSSGYKFTDKSANWAPNQWAGYMFFITAGTGLGTRMLPIISNTSNTLTVAWSPAPAVDSTTVYVIADSATPDGAHPTPRCYERVATQTIVVPSVFAPY